MSNNKEKMQRARDFIAANLAECCREELEWQNTALLRNGKLRAAARIYEEVDAVYAIPLAQAEIARQAMQLASQPVVLSDEQYEAIRHASALLALEGYTEQSADLFAILAAKEQAK